MNEPWQRMLKTWRPVRGPISSTMLVLVLGYRARDPIRREYRQRAQHLTCVYSRARLAGRAVFCVDQLVGVVSTIGA
jgi:hypothetical protein